jgi:GTP-dependent dephospho-CoA kinase
LADLKLTPSIRRRLKRPLGRLFRAPELSGEEFSATLDRARMVVTVGDRVTESIYEMGRTPDVQVVDQVERRVKRKAPEIPFERLIEAKNPAGVITGEAIQALRQAFEGDLPARVLIHGEEDLLAIPAVDQAPLGSVVFYGQPGEGVVAVVVDDRAKASSRRTLLAMRGSSRKPGPRHKP